MFQSIIPVFFACDTDALAQTEHTVRTLIANASEQYRYHVHILYTELPRKSMLPFLRLETANCKIFFENVSSYLESIHAMLPLRDYYAQPSYFCLYISEMFPEYRKALYLDGNDSICEDVSKLYLTDIGDAYVGANHECEADTTHKQEEAKDSRFQTGVLLINCAQFRKFWMLDRFLNCLNKLDLSSMQGYLNVLCKNHVYWLDSAKKVSATV